MTTPKRKRTDLGRAQLFSAFLILSILCIGGAVFLSAWNKGQRRELFIPNLEAILRKSPNDGELLCILAARHAEAGNYAIASDLLKRAVGAGQTDSLIWLTWAASEIAQGKRQEARAILLLGEKDAPHAARDLKDAMTRVGNLPQETTDAKAAQVICPPGANGLLELFAPETFLSPFIETLGKRNPYESGYATRENWAKKEPKNALAKSLWSDALLKNTRLREAEKFALEAVALDGKSPDANLAYANVLFKGGLLAKAGLYYKSALQYRPKWVPALIGLGNVGIEKNLISTAVDAFERAEKVEPENPDVWIGLGRAYANQKLRHDKAMASFATAARIAPDRTDFYPYYSDAMRMNFRFTEAEELLRKRLADAPNDSRSLFLMGAVLLDHERTPQREKEGEEFLRKSLAIDDRALIVSLRLAQLLFEQNRQKEAIPILEKAQNLNPRDPQVLTQLSRAYQRTGNAQTAAIAAKLAQEMTIYSREVEELEQKERANPSDVAVHEELAALYRKGGEPDKATKQEEIIYYLQRYPDAAKRGLESLQRGTASVIPADETVLKQRR